MSQTTLGSFETSAGLPDGFVLCFVCERGVDQDICMRLTPWDEPVDEETEWCCVECASKAVKKG